MSAPAPYVLGDLEAQPGSQVRGYCRVNLGPDTVALPIAITHGTEPGRGVSRLRRTHSGAVHR